MKIAIISDIHANLPALEAVLKHMDQHCPDMLFCLGDLVNFAGWDNETIDLVRSRNIVTVLGNHDESIGKELSDFPFSYKTEEQRQFGLASVQRVNQHLMEANRDYLAGLPFSLSLNFSQGIQPLTMTLVHGSVYANIEYVTGEASESYLRNMLAVVKSDVLVMGHTHIPYHRKIYAENGKTAICRHVINAGSVGKPKQSDNRAYSILIDIGPRFDLRKPEVVRAAFKFVPYDVEVVGKHLQKIGLPCAYDSFLREGR